MKQDLISDIQEWFKAAVPNPNQDNITVQIGCHLEEVHEMVGVLARTKTNGLPAHLAQYSNFYKNKSLSSREDVRKVMENEYARILLADALFDQIVTAIGVAYMTGIDIHGGLAEVNRSNWSKFEDGKPVFDENGKIKKGRNYTPPQLEQFINNGTNAEKLIEQNRKDK